MQVTHEDVELALKQEPARFVMPTLAGEASFDYGRNNGKFVIGAGERAFTLHFSESGHGSIHIYNDPSDIKTVAVAPGVKSIAEVGNASKYNASPRSRTIGIGDAAILRNQHNFWAAVCVDEVLVRRSGPDGNSRMTLRYHIPPVPNPSFETGVN